MSNEPIHRDWVKLWVKECLLGTIREELTPEERGIWYDFIVLAGHSRFPGIICANENVPFSNKRIAEILNVPLKLLQKCVRKFVDSGRLSIDNNGCFHLEGWDKYQYSDYNRQKKYRGNNNSSLE